MSKNDTVGQLHGAGVGRHGSFAIDARVATNGLGSNVDGRVDSAGWIGVRRTALSYLPEGRFALEPTIRVGFPMAASGPNTRVEAGLAMGALAGRFTWVADVGFRMSVEDEARRTPAPTSHGFLLLGATHDTLSWLRVFGVVDGHLLRTREVLAGGSVVAAETLGRGGLSLGGETRGMFFGSASFRLSPWENAGGVFAAHFAAGVRGL